MSHDAGAFVNRQGETWTSAHFDFVGGQVRRHANIIVVDGFDVRQMQILTVLPLVDDHTQHLGHSAAHMLNDSITVGRIGAGSKLAHARQLICSV